MLRSEATGNGGEVEDSLASVLRRSPNLDTAAAAAAAAAAYGDGDSRLCEEGGGGGGGGSPPNEGNLCLELLLLVL